MKNNFLSPLSMKVMFAAALAAACALPAAAGSAKVAAASGQFLEIPVGARAAALGSAYGAAAQDATAIYWNPAALTAVAGRSAALMHAALFGEFSLDFLGYAQTVKGLGSFGLGLQRLDAGSIDRTDQYGLAVGGSVNPGDTAVSLAYARKISGFSAGVCAKSISSELSGKASALAADFGVLSPAYLDGRLTLALGAQNLGGKLKYDQVSESLPSNVRLGGAFTPAGGWLLVLDLDLPNNNGLYAGAGAEKRFALNGFGAAVRAGYNTRNSGDAGGLTGFSTGFGLDLAGLRLDYALLFSGDLGEAHRVSLVYGF